MAYAFLACEGGTACIGTVWKVMSCFPSGVCQDLTGGAQLPVNFIDYRGMSFRRSRDRGPGEIGFFSVLGFQISLVGIDTLCVAGRTIARA